MIIVASEVTTCGGIKYVYYYYYYYAFVTVKYFPYKQWH